MQVVVKGKNIELTEALRDYAEQKVGKIDKLDIGFREVEVKLVIEKNPSIQANQIVEITVYGKTGRIIRAAEADRDMYVSIDKAVSKAIRQIKKFHGKQINRTQGQESALRAPVEISSEPVASSPMIVRRKSISLKPMDTEEAVLQMEMLAHDFFVFLNSETDGISVVYRRNDGDLGLIETSR